MPIILSTNNNGVVSEMPLSTTVEKSQELVRVGGPVLRVLALKSREWGLPLDSQEFAERMDEEDELKEFRDLFHYPKKKNLPQVDINSITNEDEEAIYFCGHSLGLPLKSIDSHLKEVLNNWAERGVHSHFHGYLPVAYCDLPLKDKMAEVVGAKPSEIALMNGLTVNIHVMLSSFYKPTANRHKILMMHHGFPSDLFAVQGQIRLHGYDPESSILFVKPREGEELLNPRDIISIIEKEGKGIALIFLEGVHYYTGQLLDMKHITEVGHRNGCVVGFDCAHAAGNVELQLHDWNVDFAVWCTYKYMNSGAGSLAGVFVHKKVIQNGSSNSFPMLRGWWGVEPKSKFQMQAEFEPAEGADRFKLSNPSPFLAATVLANLEVFNAAGMDALVKKQKQITGYLEFLLKKHFPASDKTCMELPHIKLISPNQPHRRGCMLSLTSTIPLDTIEIELKKRGIVCDIRKPSVIRVTPIPLYNKYIEVQQFVTILREIFTSISYGKIDTK